jgi:phage terminase large subunit-like protein
VIVATLIERNDKRQSIDRHQQIGEGMTGSASKFPTRKNREFETRRENLAFGSRKIQKPDINKRARVIAQTDLFAAGSIRLPRRAAWLEDLTEELLAFPGRHDDQVDALTQDLAGAASNAANSQSASSAA